MATDIATLLSDIYSASPEPISAEVRQILEQFGADPDAGIPWPSDAQIWQRWQSDKLLSWLRQTAPVSECVWIDAEDADWWITATMKSVASYSRLFDAGGDRALAFRLISRHVSTVFAPFNGSATLENVGRLGGILPPEQRRRLQEALADPRFDRAHLAAVRDVYWSWRLSDFADVDGSIVCTPLLAIWSEWPSSSAWAPQDDALLGLRGAAERKQLTGDEVASLLQETFWQQIETVFSIARGGCGLGIAEPEFADIENRPPVFFYASPIDVPVRPEEYADGLRPAIMPLVRSCLLSTDPLAQEVAWGLLEGDLVALRRERILERNTRPWYLLLPTSASPSPIRSIEDDIASVASRLTYLEFSIGHEARDVYTDIEPLAVRAGMWGGTLDLVNTVTGEAIDLLPSVGKRQFRHFNERLAALHLVLHRLQTDIETATSDASQVDRKYQGYTDGTDDYLRRRVTISWVPRISTLNLRDALQNAYPYQFVKQPLGALHGITNQLSQEVERISTSLKTILELSDRRTRDDSSRLSGMSSFVIALLALLVGLAQVLGAQAAPTPTRLSTTPSNFIDVFLQSPELISAARLLFVAVGVALLATGALYIAVWLYQRRPKPRHKFIEAVRRFRAQVSTAQEHRRRAQETRRDELWQQVDRLDDEAVKILAGLWQELRRAVDSAGGGGPEVGNRTGPQVRVQGVREWESRARILEHAIELFDLLPRTIPLPRALCVLRFKSTDYNTRTAVSDWDFDTSLAAAGFSPLEVDLLKTWLSTPANQQRMREWDVATLAQALNERGVTAVPGQRTPARWSGALYEEPARLNAS